MVESWAHVHHTCRRTHSIPEAALSCSCAVALQNSAGRAGSRARGSSPSRSSWALKLLSIWPGRSIGPRNANQSLRCALSLLVSRSADCVCDVTEFSVVRACVCAPKEDVWRRAALIACGLHPSCSPAGLQQARSWVSKRERRWRELDAGRQGKAGGDGGGAEKTVRARGGARAPL